MKKLLCFALFAVFAVAGCDSKNNDSEGNKDSVTKTDPMKSTENIQRIDYKDGVEHLIAKNRIKAFQETTYGQNDVVGIYYTLRELENYIAKYKEIVKAHEDQGMKPAQHEFAIGHIFTLKDGKMSFIVAPILYDINDPKKVLDPYRHETAFLTNLRTTDDKPNFYYNEGQLWP